MSIHKDDIELVKALFTLVKHLDTRVSHLEVENGELSIFIGSEPFGQHEFRNNSPTFNWFKVANHVFNYEFGYDFVYPETNTDKEPIT